MTQKPRLEARNIVKRFGSFIAVNGVSLEAAPGEIVGLIGPSGSGKSTLLRCLAQLEEPTEGAVLIDGQPFGREILADGRIKATSRSALNQARPKIGFVFQSLNLWPHLTALQNVTKGLIVVKGMHKDKAVEIASNLISGFGLGGKLHRRPGDLSGGERQRIAICRALAMEPAALLFDEPTSALDPELVGEVADLLRNLTSTQIGMVITTHDMRFARTVADKVVFLERGVVVASGEPAVLLDSPMNHRLKDFLSKLH